MSEKPFVSPETRLVAADWKATKRPSPLIEGSMLPPLLWAPPESTLTRVVCPVANSWTKTSVVLFVSPVTNSLAADWKTTNFPSALICGEVLSAVASVPVELTLTRTVVSRSRSWTKMSCTPFVSSDTRFVASDSKATYRPSPLIEASPLPPLASTPRESTLTRSIAPVRRSRTKMSHAVLVSPGTRFAASLMITA